MNIWFCFLQILLWISGSVLFRYCYEYMVLFWFAIVVNIWFCFVLLLLWISGLVLVCCKYLGWFSFVMNIWFCLFLLWIFGLVYFWLNIWFSFVLLWISGLVLFFYEYLVWFNFAMNIWFGLILLWISGLVWFGLVWFGLVWLTYKDFALMLQIKLCTTWTIFSENQKTVWLEDNIKAIIKCIWCYYKANSLKSLRVFN